MLLLTYPLAGWLLLIVVAIGVITWPRQSISSPGRVMSTFCLRLLAAVLIVLALMQPIVVQNVFTQRTYHLVDLSAATPDVLAGAVDEHWRTQAETSTEQQLLAFGQNVAAIATPADVTATTLANALQTTAETNTATQSRLADALTQLQLEADEHTRNHVIVYTDGWLSGRDPARQVAALAERGVSVEFVPLTPVEPVALVLHQAILPTRAALGRTAPLTLDLEAATAGDVTVRIASTTSTIEQTETLHVDPGQRRYTLPLTLDQPGLQTFRVTCQQNSANPSTTSAEVACDVTAPQRVAVVEADASDRVTNAVQQLLGQYALVAKAPPAQLTTILANTRPDVIVWGNPPADSVSDEALDDLRRAVLDGAGLLAIGGPNAYDLGGYADSPLAPLLPVDLQQTLSRHDPSVALVIIIDTSGSMRGARFDLAKETARLAIQRLKRHDKVGIVEFYGTKRWAARLQSAANGIDVYRALNRLSAGGGTVILPALEEAHAALLNVRAQLKHVLILTDGGVETGPFQRVITRMAEDGITASTVLVGPGQHSAFLSDLAHWGRGRAYQAPDQFRVPEIILRRPTEQRRGSAVEAETTLSAAQADPITDAIPFENLPPLTGANHLTARATADVVLQSTANDPLLVRWRYGRGFVTAWLSDLGGAWSRDLWNSDAGRKLFGNTVRQLTAANPGEQLHLSATPRLGGVEVDVRYEGAEAAIRTAPLTIDFDQAQPATQRQTVDPLTPGHWNAWFEGVPPGTHTLTATSDQHPLQTSGAIVVAPDVVRKGLTANTTMLNQLTGLAKRSLPATPPSGNRPIYHDIWPWLVLGALGCFLLNVLIRRWPMSTSRAASAALLLLAVQAIDQRPAYALEAPTGVDQATTLELNGELATAQQTLAQQADKLAPDQQETLRLRRAVLLHDAGQQTEAIKLLSQDLPNDPALRRARACLLALLQETAAARDVLANDSDNADDLILRSLLARQLNDLPHAATDLENAAERASKRSDQQFIAALQVTVANARGTLAELVDTWRSHPATAEQTARPLFQVLWDLGRRNEALDLAAEQGWLTAAPGSRDETFAREIVTLMLESEDITGTTHALRTLRAKQPEQVRWSILLARVQLAQQDSLRATQTLIDGVLGSTSVPDLFRIADLAGDANLDTVVNGALEHIIELDPEQAFAVALWRAEWAGGRGDEAQLEAALQRARSLHHDNRERVLLLVQTLERLERFDDAIALLAQLEAQQPDLSLTEHRAWLLEHTEQLDKARDAWNTIWRNATSLARQRRAAERLLDLSARTNQIAELAINIEDRVAAGTATSGELDLLLEIYVRVGDSISAGEILLMLADQQADQVATLKRLAEAYLRMGQVGLCNEILNRLRQADPAGAPDYLQQQVLLAIERKRPDEAQQHAHELARLLGDAPMASELTASIFSLLEDYPAAAKAYAQALQENPERVELWLLWADAMRSANVADEAVARLLKLLDEATQDDLFLVAVDGLLNLDAPPAALEFALRRLLVRMAADPKRTYLFDAASDVLETLGRRDDINAMMEIAVAYSGEQRGSLIREMMDRAKALRKVPETLALGTTLILLDHHVPADVFLDLGALLLQYDRPQDAARTFSRAMALGELDIVRRRVGRIYLTALQPEIAGRIFNAQLATMPDDIELRILTGAASEQAGDFETAFEHYAQAYQNCMRQLGNSGQVADLSAGGRRQRIAVNVSELEQFVAPAIDGMLAVARSEKARDKLLNIVTEDAREALTRASESNDDGETKIIPAQLVNKFDAVRRVALSLGQPRVALEADQRLLRVYPHDPKQRQRIATTYQSWGQLDLALLLIEDADAMHAALAPTWIYGQLQTLGVADDAAAVDGLDLDSSDVLLPALLMLGHDAQATRLLERCETRADTLSTDVLLNCVRACVVLADDAALARWMPRLVDACGRIVNLDQRQATLERGLRIAWWSLGTEQRRDIAQRIVTQARGVSPPADQLEWLAMQLLQSLDATPDASPQQLEVLAARGAGERGFLNDLLAHTPVKLHPALLEQVWANQPEDKRADLLASVAASYPTPPSEAFLTKYRQLLTATPALRISRHFPYRELTDANWHLNTRAAALGLSMAATVQEWFGKTPAVLVASAQAYAAANDNEQVAQFAAEAIDQLCAIGLIDLESQRMVQALLPAMPPAALHTQREQLTAQPASDRTRFEQYLLGNIDARLGDETAAVEAYEDAFQRRPADRIVRRELVDYLVATHRWPRLVSLLGAYAADPSVMDTWERARLAEAYIQCGALKPATVSISRDTNTLASIMLMELDAHTNAPQRVVRRLRQKLISNRLERRFFAPNAQYDLLLGGLRGYRHEREKAGDRPQLYTALAAQVPQVTFELLALLRQAAPDASHLYRLAEACWTGLATQHANRITENLPFADQQRFLTPHEFALAISAGAAADDLLWSGMRAAQRYALLADWQTNETALLALVHGDLRSVHAEQARAIMRWLVVADLDMPRNRVDTKLRLERLDAYLATFPAEDRGSVSRRILKLSRPLPTEHHYDSFDAGLLKLAVEYGQPYESLDALSRGDGTFLARAISQAALIDQQWETYEQAIARLIDLTIRVDRTDFIPLEAEQVLPEADRISDLPRAIQTIAEQCRAAHAAGRLNSMMTVRVLSLLAWWCLEQDQAKLAEDLLAKITPLAGEQPNSLWLWIVDIEQRLNPEAAMLRLEQLAQAGLLTQARLSELLQACSSDAGDALLVASWEYLYQPEWLERARRKAKAAGDDAAALKIEQRLSELSPLKY